MVLAAEVVADAVVIPSAGVSSSCDVLSLAFSSHRNSNSHS
jgi:hypothetical protein